MRKTLLMQWKHKGQVRCEQIPQLSKIRWISRGIIFSLTVSKVTWVFEAEVLVWNYSQVGFNDILLNEITFSNRGEWLNPLSTSYLRHLQGPHYEQHSPSGQVGAYILPTLSGCSLQRDRCDHQQIEWMINWRLSQALAGFREDLPKAEPMQTLWAWCGLRVLTKTWWTKLWTSEKEKIRGLASGRISHSKLRFTWILTRNHSYILYQPKLLLLLDEIGPIVLTEPISYHFYLSISVHHRVSNK